MAGQGAIFLCAILWSTSGLFIRLLDWHPMVIGGSRSILAAVVLLTLRRLSHRRREAASLDSAPHAKAPILRALALAAYGLCYTATMILFVIANKMTASANVILLQYTAPVWAALLGWLLLREKPHWEHWGAMAIVCLGMLLVFSKGISASSMLGNALALISGITLAANSVVLRLKKDDNPADILIFSHIQCALFSIPFFILHAPSFTVNNVLCILFMGIFQIGFASALLAYGIRRVPAVQAMLIAAIEPVLNPIWVLLAIGEKPEISVLAGGGLIIAAVIFSSTLSALRRRS